MKRLLFVFLLCFTAYGQRVPRVVDSVASLVALTPSATAPDVVLVSTNNNTRIQFRYYPASADSTNAVSPYVYATSTGTGRWKEVRLTGDMTGVTVDGSSIDATTKLNITNGTAVNLTGSLTGISLAGDIAPTSQATRTVATDSDTLYTIGDSFTYGSAATTYTNTYVSKMAATLGLSAVNLGHGSFTIPDANWSVFSGWVVTNATGPSSYVFTAPSTITEDHNWTTLIGFNDLRTSSTSASMYRLGLDHLIHWLAIPTSAKRFAQSPDASTGTWTTNAWSNGLNTIAASSSSGTLTFSNVIGSELYVGFLAWATNYGGTITVSVDGVTVESKSVASAAYGNREYINGSDPVIPDYVGPYGNGKIDFCPQIIKATGLGLGAHTVVITAASNPVEVIWVSGNGFARTLREGPNVFVGSIPRQSPWTGSGTDALHRSYNAQLSSSVASARLSGLRVSYAPVGESYAPATMQDVDGVHPTNAGHTVIADAFALPMTGDLVALAAIGYVPTAIASGTTVGSGATASKTGTVRLSATDALVWRDSNGFDGVNLSNAANGLIITAPNTGNSVLRSYSFNGAAYPFAEFTYANSAAGSPVMFNQNGSAGLSSGTYIMDRLQATINQSGTAGYSLLKVDATETAIGSGDRNALEVTLDTVTTGRILPTGRLLLNSKTAGTSTSTRFGRGSTANSTFLFTYDDSTQDLQHEFYGSSWTWKTNSTQTAGGAFAIGPSDGTLTINPTTTFANSLRLASLGSDPASPSDGSLWYRFDTDLMKLRANGATVDVVVSGSSPQLTTIELGHASDTTLARLNAGGEMTIEGKRVQTSGTADYWDVDAGAMTPWATDGATATTETLTTNSAPIDTYVFSTSAVKNVSFKAAPPWDATTVTLTLNWRANSLGDAVWGVSAISYKANEYPDIAFGTEILVTNTANAVLKLNTATTAAITPAGTLSTNSTILFKVRNVTTSASDTLTNAPSLWKALVNYTRQ